MQQGGGTISDRLRYKVGPVCHCRRNPSSSSLEPSSLVVLQHLSTQVMSQLQCVCMRVCVYVVFVSTLQ